MSPFKYRFSAGFLLLAGVGALAHAQDTAPAFPTNEQLRHLRSLGNPALSPDGLQVLLRVSDATADGGKSHLWLIDVAGGEPRQLTYSPDADKRGEHDGDWMPDGKSILFLAKRGEHTQLYRLPMSGGEAKALDLKVVPAVDESKREGALPPKGSGAGETRIPSGNDNQKDKNNGDGRSNGKSNSNDGGRSEVDSDPRSREEKPAPVMIDVAGFRISPDGKTLAVIARDPQTPGEKKQKDAKADATWVDHELHRSRLYLVSLEGDLSKPLTATSLPGDVRGLAWSADSTRLVAVAEEPNGADELGPAASAWMVRATETAPPVRMAELPATTGSAMWSQDGATIYFLAQAKRDTPPGYEDLYADAVSSKVVRDLTDGYLGSMGRGEPIALKGGGLLAAVEEGLESGLVRVEADGRRVRVKLPVSSFNGVSTNAAQNGWAFVGSSGGLPTELLYSAKLGEPARVVKTPALLPSGCRSLAPKRVTWKSDRFTIEGMLYLPPDAGTTHKVPLIAEVHGGPLGAYADSFSPFDDFLLGQGWAVLKANPRGSAGYGAAFAAANHNDLGGGDFRDIMAGVDFVLKTEPVDESRMALMGYSYGGEMAGFAEGKTARFKAIVSMAPVIDQFSEYGTERGSYYDQWYYGKPWEHAADAWRQSPLSGASRAKTPFLLLQGESDTTDPLGQSQEMYRALRQMQVPVELVTYPRVDHGPLGAAIFGSPTGEPWHGFDARQHIVEFVGKAFAGMK